MASDLFRALDNDSASASSDNVPTPRDTNLSLLDQRLECTRDNSCVDLEITINPLPPLLPSPIQAVFRTVFHEGVLIESIRPPWHVCSPPVGRALRVLSHRFRGQWLTVVKVEKLVCLTMGRGQTREGVARSASVPKFIASSLTT